MDKAAYPDDTALLDLCARKGAQLRLHEGRLFMKPGQTPFTGEERQQLRRRPFLHHRTARRQTAECGILRRTDDERNSVVMTDGQTTIN